MSEQQAPYDVAGRATQLIIFVEDIHVEFEGKTVAILARKRIRAFARDAAEIMNDGRIVYRHPDGKWYWEIKP